MRIPRVRAVFPAIIAAAIFLSPVAPSSGAADVSKKTADAGFLLSFLSGDYRLVGQRPDSGATYSGQVTLRESGRALAVTRVIAGMTSHSTASIETSHEGAKVIRMRFSFEGVKYAATYLWQTDLDNYPRLTGYVYRPRGETKSPGLEVLFHIPPTPAE